MSVLPMVTAFILLFALCSYSLLHQYISVNHESLKVRGAHRIERVLLSQLDRTAYQKHRAKDSKPKKEPEQTPLTEYVSPRCQFNKKPLTKLNLAPLLENENGPEKAVLIAAATRLFKGIYKHTPLYQDKMEETMIKELLHTLKKNPEIETFDEIFACIENKRELFYKFFRGTQKYELNTNIGIPPLSDFFTFNKKCVAVHFAHASQPVLEALFELPISAQIMSREKTKWLEDPHSGPLTQTELEELLIKERKNPSDYAPLLNFSKGPAKGDHLIFHDKLSKVQKKMATR